MKKLIIYLSFIATVGFSADVILGKISELTWTGTGADKVASFGFNPNSIAGLQMWLDASDSSTLTLSGTNVLSWADKSANGFTASNSNVSLCPVVISSFYGNKNAIKFDGINDILPLNKNIGVTNTTIFIVFNRATGGIHSAFLGNKIGTNGETPITWYSDNGIYTVLNSYYRDLQFQTQTGKFLFSYSVSSSDIQTTVLRRNKTELTLSARQAYGAGLTLDCIGYGLGVYGNGELCEIIIYNNTLSESQIIEVENYLYSKWGI